jgi:hypothetical protein
MKRITDSCQHIGKLQNQIYENFNDFSKNHFIRGKFQALPIALIDVTLDTLKTPASCIENLFAAIVHLLRAPFHLKEPLMKRCLICTEQALAEATFTPVALLLSPIKFCYQALHNVYDPSKAISIEQATEEAYTDSPGLSQWLEHHQDSFYCTTKPSKEESSPVAKKAGRRLSIPIFAKLPVTPNRDTSAKKKNYSDLTPIQNSSRVTFGSTNEEKFGRTPFTPGSKINSQEKSRSYEKHSDLSSIHDSESLESSYEIESQEGSESDEEHFTPLLMNDRSFISEQNSDEKDPSMDVSYSAVFPQDEKEEISYDHPHRKSSPLTTPISSAQNYNDNESNFIDFNEHKRGSAASQDSYLGYSFENSIQLQEESSCIDEAPHNAKENTSSHAKANKAIAPPSRIRSPIIAFSDVILDVAKIVVDAIENVAFAALNILAVAFNKAYSIKKTIGYTELFLENVAAIPAAALLTPLKFVYQMLHILYDPKQATPAYSDN